MVDQLNLVSRARFRPTERAGGVTGVLRRFAHAPLSNDTLMKEYLLPENTRSLNFGDCPCCFKERLLLAGGGRPLAAEAWSFLAH